MFFSFHLAEPAISNKTIVKKDNIDRPQPSDNLQSHEIKHKLLASATRNKKKDSIGKHEISKKFYITKPVNFQNNLDGISGMLVITS